MTNLKSSFIKSLLTVDIWFHKPMTEKSVNIQHAIFVNQTKNRNRQRRRVTQRMSKVIWAKWVQGRKRWECSILCVVPLNLSQHSSMLVNYSQLLIYHQQQTCNSPNGSCIRTSLTLTLPMKTCNAVQQKSWQQNGITQPLIKIKSSKTKYAASAVCPYLQAFITNNTY